jgi:hypothetical protein
MPRLPTRYELPARASPRLSMRPRQRLRPWKQSGRAAFATLTRTGLTAPSPSRCPNAEGVEQPTAGDRSSPSSTDDRRPASGTQRCDARAARGIDATLR